VLDEIYHAAGTVLAKPPFLRKTRKTPGCPILMKRRKVLKILSLITFLTINALPSFTRAESSGPIKVGILHSLSGTMAISETSLKDVALMTIEEINKKTKTAG
jgi:ABC-type branched-subunit amino acid transport system substrate-binding protein